MKKLNLFSLLGLVALIATSCSTYKHSYRLGNVPETRIAITPTMVDVKADFEKQVKGSSDKRTNSIQDAKDNAYYNAIVQNKIDVLVDPIYKIQVRKGLFTTNATAEVTGFPGVYENPRTIFENQQTEYDAKLESLQKLTAIKEIQNEERNSVIVNSGANGSTTTTINSAPSYINQFNSLFNNIPTMYDDSKDTDKKSSSNEEKPKKKRTLFNLFGLLGR